MSDGFENLIEDGSAEAVSVDILRLWDETIGWDTNRESDLVDFEELAEKVGRKMPTSNVQGFPKIFTFRYKYLTYQTVVIDGVDKAIQISFRTWRRS